MLNHVDVEGMDRQVRFLGLLMIAGEMLPVLCAPLGLAFLLTIGAVSNDPDAMAVLATIGSFALCITFVFALPGLIAGIGLLRRKSWARYLALVVALFNMIWFPIGTLIGLYAFWVLLQDAAPYYFGDKSIDDAVPAPIEKTPVEPPLIEDLPLEPPPVEQPPIE